MQYGVACSTRLQKINSLFGSIVWAYDDNEIRDLLSGGLLLDGRSAMILCERGFAPLIGLEMDEGFVNRQKATYAVETTVSQKTGLDKDIYLEYNNVPSTGRIKRLMKGAEEWTSILTPEKEKFSPGIVTFRNKLGGRIAVFPVSNPVSLSRNFHRQTILHNLVRYMSTDRFDSVLVSGAPYCSPIHFEEPGRTVVVVMNGGTDPTSPVINVPFKKRPASATLLCPLSAPEKAHVKILADKNGSTIKTRETIPFHGFLVLEWK